MTLPNIIYILGDDQRAEYLGCAGHPILKTPNLDFLAARGVRFSRAYCTSPACTPSRCCHYTGLWERSHGVNFNSNSSLSPQAWEQSFPMLLKQAGYFLGWVGKNHVPAGQGGYHSGYFEEVFDYWYGNHGHSGFYPKEQCRGGAIYRNASLDTQVEVFTEGVMNFLDPSRKFIESATYPLPVRPQDRPFCLCVTFNLPHGVGTGNMQLRPSDDELYKSTYRDRFDEMPLPTTYRAWSSIRQPRLPRHVYNGIYLPQYDYVKEPYFLRERQVRTCQTITGIDRFVGRLMEKLEELNLADNTIIVFSTDHGLHHGEHGLGGKCFLYEEDTHIPLIIYDPRLPEHRRGQVIDRFALVPDLAPTVLELCGITPPSTMQGRSLRPLMHGEDVNWRTEFMTEQLMDIQNYPRSESLRTERWKYIRYFKRTEDPSQEGFLFRGTLDDYITCLYSTVEDEEPVYEELFDLENDPWEEHNLCLDQHPPAILEDLRERLNHHIRDRLPANGPATVPLSSS